MSYTATSTDTERVRAAIQDRRPERVTLYITDHTERSSWSVALNSCSRAEMLAWLRRLTAAAEALPPDDLDDMVEPPWCERCGAIPDDGADGLDESCGLCPACQAYNADRVIL